ncbi:MAG: hypothetical protein ACRDNE_00245 [Gaiellaceae bacterium]
MLRRLAILVGALALGVSACGGSDESSDPESSIRSYLSALADNDGETACDALTLDVRQRLVEQAGSTDCPALVDQFHEFLGSDAERLKDAEISNVSESGNEASADVSLAGETANVQLVEVEGGWRIDTFGFANQLLGLEPSP